MKFEILNDRNQIVMTTISTVCIPDKMTIDFMIKAGYKFKIDGKSANKKKIDELRK